MAVDTIDPDVPATSPSPAKSRHPSDDRRLGSAEGEPIDVNDTRAESLDRLMHAWEARFTAAISPAALRLAFSDWAMQFLTSPGKQALLIE